MPNAPSSTYRLQIRPSFTLNDAADLVDYLVDLGVGAVYLSPILTSTTGSDHGYDTVDVTAIDPARGGEQGWQALLAAARRAGIGVVVDIVPNHLGISVPAENPAWWDVLRLGRNSGFASWFDIDWSAGRIVVPVLGDDLEALGVEGDELRYHEHRFPLRPETRPGDAGSVHDQQHYRLVHHARADTELNYRRFFTVATLAGVRVEDPAVFAATHVRVIDWVKDGISGLRIDHPDGLVDPGEYLHRLRELAPQAWIVVEKILESGEALPAWPVDGTTGYDAMREVNSVFIDPAAEGLFTELDGTSSFSDVAREAKLSVAREQLTAEVRRLAALAPEVERAGDALIEIAASFDVYRSYLPAGVEHLDHALAQARQALGLGAAIDAIADRLHDPADELARRFQQLTGVVMAKGVEDSTYYRYTRFIALNEVGGDPTTFGLSLAEFHAAQADRQTTRPYSMTSLATHDTKRSEDIRARLAALSELGDSWAALRQAQGTEALLKQTFVGAGPIDRERMHAYAEKAAREAGQGTSWSKPDPAFESQVHDWVDRLYDEPALRTLLDRLLGLVEGPGWSNSLGQKLVQLTMPGVPDVYQGTEFWDDSLVDPDNRRPVDFAARRDQLRSLDGPPAIDATGAAKLWITGCALRARRDHPDLFTSYQPVLADGPAHDHLLAFDRGGAITLATRLPVGLAERGGWQDTRINLPGTYIDVLTGHPYADSTTVADLLAYYPVALLLQC